ncbi:hypothetical protein CYY_001518 [Polysphondylium violaceum]|uniref:Transmembrane protein n=1 Tax=Polysphondylium violaceum TaxID=133409 RepID=A0A8J4Q1W1_9MYCE|nr:hypothetical protein CYY_001518 [Polysphondylium violaceum]
MCSKNIFITIFSCIYLCGSLPMSITAIVLGRINYETCGPVVGKLTIGQYLMGQGIIELVFYFFSFICLALSIGCDDFCMFKVFLFFRHIVSTVFSLVGLIAISKAMDCLHMYSFAKFALAMNIFTTFAIFLSGMDNPMLSGRNAYQEI